MNQIPNKKVKDITGETFGEWIVISYSHQAKNKSSASYWNVLCSCGNTSKVEGSSLRTGRSTKCKLCHTKSTAKKMHYSLHNNMQVYFIKCGEYIKIGASNDVSRRLRDLEKSNPYKLELLYVDSEWPEEVWHNIFRHRHCHGEWFRLSI